MTREKEKLEEKSTRETHGRQVIFTEGSSIADFSVGTGEGQREKY